MPQVTLVLQLSYHPQKEKKKKKTSQIALIVMRASNKISNSENYNRMPAAEGRHN